MCEIILFELLSPEDGLMDMFPLSVVSGPLTVTPAYLLGRPALQVVPSLQVFQCDPDGHNVTEMM